MAPVMQAPDPVVIDVDFIGRGTFSGTDGSGGLEWPPAPARIFAALAHGAAGRFDGALEALEQASPPEIRAPFATASISHMVYPSSRRDTVGPRKKYDLNKSNIRYSIGRASFPDISTMTKQYGSAGWGGIPYLETGSHDLARPRLRYIIEGAALDDEQVAQLDAAAEGIGYFGRSIDAVAVSVSRISRAVLCGGDPRNEGLVLLRPVPRGRVRMWKPGYLAALDERHEWVATSATVPAPVSEHAIDRCGYVRVWEMPDTDLLMLRVTPAVSPARARTLLGRIPGAVPVVNPHSGDLIGLAVKDGGQGGDGDGAGGGALQAAADAIEEMGLEFDAPADYWPELLAGAHRRWSSRWPVHGPVAGDQMWAMVAVEVSRITGLGIGEFGFEIEPAPHAADGMPVTPGLVAWSVSVELPAPVAGPFLLGPDACPLYGEKKGSGKTKEKTEEKKKR